MGEARAINNAANKWQQVEQFASLISLWDHHRELSGGQIPEKNDIKPQIYKSFLPWVIIADSKGKGDLTVRLSSEANDRLLGHNLTGVNMFDHYQPELRAMYWDFFDPILAGDLGGYSNRILMGQAREKIRCEVIYLPLRTRNFSTRSWIAATCWTPLEQRTSESSALAEKFGLINDLEHMTLDTFTLRSFSFEIDQSRQPLHAEAFSDRPTIPRPGSDL